MSHTWYRPQPAGPDLDAAYERALLSLRLLVDEDSGRLRLNACAGIPEETVRQIEIRALKKLRAYSDELKEYVYS